MFLRRAIRVSHPSYHYRIRASASAPCYFRLQHTDAYKSLSTSISSSRCLRTLSRPRVLPVTAGIDGVRRASVAASDATAADDAPKQMETTEAGEGYTGHISAGENEALFFFDNVLPIKLQWLLHIPYLSLDQRLPTLLNHVDNPRYAAASPIHTIQKALPPQMPVQITEVIPRLREGGVFVRMKHDGTSSLEELEQSVSAHLKEHPIKPWFNPLQQVTASLVRGKPWVEDLYRIPSSRLRVEFLPAASDAAATEMTQEDLFSFFRRYGKIWDIVPQPTDSKTLPKYAYVDFSRMRSAIVARNCLHGILVDEVAGGGKSGTLLKLTYEQKIKAHWIREWLMSHPRLVIPAVAAIVAAITVAIFDPVRTFFVKMHVSHPFPQGRRLWEWLRTQFTDVLSTFRTAREDTGLKAIWDDRRADIETIRTWLLENADTFIVVQGPRGSGKKELVVNQALKGRKATLIIDCKGIQEARGDSATIEAAASEVGYRPVFSWMNNISSMIDLAAQGAIGTKAGFSETLDAQLAKIWATTTAALREIALEGRRKDDKDAHLGDDEYLEAHPERRPVVVIDNFLHRANESSVVYDKLSEWAAAMTTANVAHVIFLTTDVSFSKSLSKALPNRIFRQISLGDCSPEVAKKFVIMHIDADADAGKGDDGEVKLTPSQRREDLNELDDCIETLGGRLTDLEFLARRIKTGENPKKAVTEIIHQSASEILKMYILDVGADSPWSALHAWLIITELANASNPALSPGSFINDIPTDAKEKHAHPHPTSTTLTPSLRYAALTLSDIFKDTSSPDTTLQALEQAELISITSTNGRPHTIKPGKPVYAAAFKHLVSDTAFKARMDLSLLTQLVSVEGKSIEKYEKELELLGDVIERGRGVEGRVRYLVTKIRGCQERIERFEGEMGVLKSVLKKEE